MHPAPDQKLPADAAHRFRAVEQALVDFSGALSARPRLLDVGGYPGTFARWLRARHPAWEATTLDVPDEELPGYVSGRGTAIPFAEGEFDAVVSIDTFEHVPPGERPQFVAELCRVARRLVVLAAPFHHPAKAECESRLNDAHQRAFGKPHPWLHEHVEHGLPRLPDTRAVWPEDTPIRELRGSYDLSAWVAAQGLALLRDLHGELDDAWAAWDDAAAEAPPPAATSVPYRHLIVAEKGGRDLATRAVAQLPPDSAGREAVALSRLFAALLDLRAARSSGEEPAAPPDDFAAVNERLREALAAAERENERLRAGSPAAPESSVSKLLSGFFRRGGS